MDGTTSKFSLHDSLGHLVSKAARVIDRRIEDDLRPFGLTRVTWCILVAVVEEGKKHPSDIASFVGIDRTATSRALRQLEHDGLIERHMGKGDRRMTEVDLTDLGRSQFRAALPKCREAISAFHSRFAPQDLDALKLHLKTIAAED